MLGAPWNERPPSKQLFDENKYKFETWLIPTVGQSLRVAATDRIQLSTSCLVGCNIKQQGHDENIEGKPSRLTLSFFQLSRQEHGIICILRIAAS